MGLKPHVHVHILKLTCFVTALILSNLVIAGTFNIVPASDCSSCDGSVTFSTDLTGNVSFEWTTPDGTVVFTETNALGISSMTNLCTGVWIVTATDDNGEEEIQVASVSTPAESAGTSSDLLTCNDASPTNLFFELGGTPQFGGDWTAPDGSVSDGTFDPSLSDPGIYTYTVDNGGCIETSAVLVSVNQNADPGLSTTYLICETYDPFFLTDLLAGSPDYGGIWTGPGNVPIDGWFDPATMETGLFSYELNTVEGCGPVFSTMYVIENFLPDPGLPSSIEICPNAVPFDLTLLLDGTPEMGGQWYDEDNDEISNIFDPLVMPAGTYVYEVDGATPCPDQETTITVGYTDGITAGTGGAVDLCSLDNPISLENQVDGNPDPGGTWTNSLGQEIDNLFDPSVMAPGDYTYTVEAVGCQPVSSVLSVSIEQAQLAGDDALVSMCENIGSLNLNDLLVNADGGGEWLDAFGDPVDPAMSAVVGNESYIYFQAGTICPDANAIISVIIDPLPDAGGDQVLELCEDAGVYDLTNMVPDATDFAVVWTDLADNVVLPQYDPAVGLQEVFVYQVLSGNSCPDDQALITMESEAILFADGSVALDLCNTEAEINLNDQLPIANLPENLWQNGDGNASSSTFDPATAETDVFTYTFVNGDVCPPSVFEVDVEVFEQPDAGLNNAEIFCFNQGLIDLTSILVDADDGGYWTFNGGAVPSTFDPLVDAEGEYSYNIDANGPCPASQSLIDIAVDPGVTFDAGLDVAACAGSDPIQIGEDPEETCTYTWNPPTYLDDDTSSNPNVSMVNNSSEVQSINYVVTISNGICETTDTVLVTVYPIPDVITNEDFEACVGETFELVAGGASTYEWLPASYFENNSTPGQTTEIDETTLFTVIGTSDFGCIAEASVLVDALPLPDVNFDADPVQGCVPLQVQLINLSDAEEGATYSWVFGDGTISEEENPVFVFAEAGTHDVSLLVNAVNGCSNILVAEDYITVHPIPLASFHHNPADLSVLNSEIITSNSSVGAVNYEWEFFDGQSYTEVEPVIDLPQEPGIYELCLTAINEFACEDTVCRSIFIAGEFIAYAPNAFTPDNDGINDTFAPVLQGYDPNTYELRIFNRWGELIFESDDPSEPWQGNSQRGDYFVQNDLYVWTLSVRDLYTAEIHKLEGHITVIR